MDPNFSCQEVILDYPLTTGIGYIIGALEKKESLYFLPWYDKQIYIQMQPYPGFRACSKYSVLEQL